MTSDMPSRLSEMVLPEDGDEDGFDPTALELLRVKEKLRLLESRLESVEVEGKTDGGKLESLDIHDHDNPMKIFQTIPAVRKVRLEEFKNRFSPDDCRYAVDVLMAGQLLEQELQQEVQSRQDNHRRKVKVKGKNKPTKAPRSGGISLIDKAIHTGRADDVWIQRIRIQSPALLTILSRLSGETWSIRPRTFFRPFRRFIHIQDKMKAILEDLETKFGTLESQTPNDPGSGDIRPRPNPLDESTKPAVDESLDALKDVRCFVKFIDEEIMPLYRQYREPGEEGGKRRVRFDDLWYLFRPGDLAYCPNNGVSEKYQQSSIRQSAWRIFGVQSPTPRYKLRNAEQKRYLQTSEDESDEFRIECYYIDFDGDEFCTVTEMFRIRPFEGELRINSLPIFPFRFVENSEDLHAEYQKHGQQYLDYTKHKHFSYNWWTITCGPKGETVTNSEGVEMRNPLHVNSDVIVDPVEAFQACPAWKPSSDIISAKEEETVTTADELAINEWSGPDRAKLLSQETEIFQLRSSFDSWERNNNLHEDLFLRSVRENAHAGKNTTQEFLGDQDLCILPKRVFAYVLHDRRFVQLDARRLKPIVASRVGFESLKINPKHKRTILALIDSHFANRLNERKHGVECKSQDLIPGKGRGLTILLHGIPGVGKTATAEAVAQACIKPLFSITSGDLGVTPKDVEKALQEIFRLASIWDAILLLDEVDTFFSQRSQAGSDVTKNALVSVFLRVLEYYHGILFLTTNRLGALDEAFKSRVHISIYYPPLDETQTMEIWKMNIGRLNEIEEEKSNSTGEEPLEVFEEDILRFAAEQFRHHSQGKGRWNGRQIRNAFQVAASLARFEMRTQYADDHKRTQNPGPPPRPKLGVDHFEAMARLTEEFDDYIIETLGKTHEDLAWENLNRADHIRGQPTRQYSGDEFFSNGAYLGPQSPRQGAPGPPGDFAFRHGSLGRAGGYASDGIHQTPFGEFNPGGPAPRSPVPSRSPGPPPLTWREREASTPSFFESHGAGAGIPPERPSLGVMSHSYSQSSYHGQNQSYQSSAPAAQGRSSYSAQGLAGPHESFPMPRQSGTAFPYITSPDYGSSPKDL